MPSPRSLRGFLAWAGIALAIAVVGAFAFVVDTYENPTGSMIPTLVVGERFVVEDVSYRFGDPEVNDIVVMHPPQGADINARCGVRVERDQVCDTPVDDPSDVVFIKRIVATPGDTLRIVGGRAIVNGEPVEDDFIKPCGEVGRVCDFPKEVTIPEDHYFVLGDNRGASEDSRFWGPVPKEWIVGKVLATYWPPDRIGFP